MADVYLRPPATGEVEAMSEKQLVNFITGAAVEKTESEGIPLTDESGVPFSGKSFDVRERVQSSDGLLTSGRGKDAAGRRREV